MNWSQYRTIMERNAIKTDDMATEDAYFMATHMPFSHLEVFQGGRTSSAPTLMNENEVFENIISNPNDEHRMVIVRGNNGTGKSHLIRFLKAKFENSPSTIYNPATEQLIFLRRLNNSVRGAFAQLIEQNVIIDSNVRNKIEKFVLSSDSKDETAFKTDILFSYIAAVSSDQSDNPYKPVICRDIASFMSDSRVREHLLREGGAISRCYNVITAPSNQVLNETTIFSEDDFNVSKILREVYRRGDPQASDFASTLKDDDYEITRLVNYLNRFTREVVQRCADISSESTKTVFTELRRDLKKQGKNLTLFIEDFTGFTGIDSELITVLSTEHGGNYSDLCRVTAVIGITNAYYDQFRDNFTDRVTHQINVTDSAFGTKEFLIHMTGRYLNAIYCNPDSIRHWYKEGADISSLPISQFKPPCDWETTTIADKNVTLYPFNSQALLTLYDNLTVQSPRMFLLEVIRAQLKEYFDGKTYNEGWDFPLNPANIQMSRGPHSSAVDRMEFFSTTDKSRIKSVLALWGNGSASAIQNADGIITIGGVNKVFFEDIGLGLFNGIGKVNVNSSKDDVHIQIDNSQTSSEFIPESIPKSSMTSQMKNYLRNKDDITNWFTNNESLLYDSDYRTWLKSLIKGENNQSGAINWQDMGIPAYIAEERLSGLVGYYIEDQKSSVNKDKIIVYMDRSAESRDALFALNEWNYAEKSWDFDGAVYYQQRLITWLERRKDTIIEKVSAIKKGDPPIQTLEWCLTLQYLKACILGQKIDTHSPLTIITSLFSDVKEDNSIKRDTREWNDLIQFIKNKGNEFDSALSFIRCSSATTMGAVHFSTDTRTKSFYRVNELMSAVERLVSLQWDIENELPNDPPSNHMLFNHASLLKTLYANIKKVMKAEVGEISRVFLKLTDYIGELTQENISDTIYEIQKLYNVYSLNGVMGSNELLIKYDHSPRDQAKEIMKHIDTLSAVASASPVDQLIVYSENSLHELEVFLRDLQSIALKAEQEEEKANKNIAKIGNIPGLDDLSRAASTALESLSSQLEAMEVNCDVIN